MESVYKLGAVITLSDLAGSGLQNLDNHWKQLKETMKVSEAQIKQIDGYFEKSKQWGIAAGVATGLSTMSIGLIKARSETATLESNIKSLGVSSSEVDKISMATGLLAANMGISKNDFLTGVYDIKSGISSLTADTLPGFAQSVATTAAATKGDFASLSKLFAMTYNQYKSMYADMSDNDFGKMVGNTISVAVQKYRTDGASMNQAMNSLGSTAASLGITLTEQTAVLGTLQNVMNPGEAGTAYRAFLSKVGTGLTTLGISANDATGKLKSMPAIMRDLNAKFGDSIDAEKEMPELIKAFGEEGAKTVLNLMPHIKALDSDITEMGNSVKNMDFSTMDKMAKENLNNSAGQWKRITAGMHALGDTVSKVTDGPLTRMLSGVAYVVEGLVKLGNESAVFRFVAAGIVIVLPPLVALISATMSYVYFMRGYVAIKALAAAANTNYTGSVLLNTGAIFYNTAAKGINTVREWGAIAAMRAGVIARQTNIAVMGLERTGMTISTMLYAVATGKIGLATAAQWAWNAAMAANPVGLVVFAVAALIGIVAAAIIYFDTWSGWVKALWNDHKLLIGGILALSGPVGWLIGGIALLADNWDRVSGAIEKAWIFMKGFLGISSNVKTELTASNKVESQKVQGIKEVKSATQDLVKVQTQPKRVSIMEQNIATDWVNGMQAPANIETPQQMMQSMNAEQVVQKITSEKSSPARVVTNNNSIMGSMNNGGGGFSGGANITLNLQSLVQNLQIDKFNEAELEKVFGPLLAKALMKEVEKHGIVEAA